MREMSLSHFPPFFPPSFLCSVPFPHPPSLPFFHSFLSLFLSFFSVILPAQALDFTLVLGLCQVVGM